MQVSFIYFRKKSMFSPGFLIHKSSDISTKDFFSIIQKIGKPKEVKKGQLIVRYGSSPSFFFFIQSGVFKTYRKLNDNEFILGFTFKGDVDCCPVSLLSGTPNNFSIEAVTSGEVLICELTDFKNCCSLVEYYAILNTVLINYLEVVEKRVIDSISLTAEQRYKLLCEKQPEQVSQIPVKHMASYLGIKIESLSRIRKKMMH